MYAAQDGAPLESVVLVALPLLPLGQLCREFQVGMAPRRPDHRQTRSQGGVVIGSGLVLMSFFISALTQSLASPASISIVPMASVPEAT